MYEDLCTVIDLLSLGPPFIQDFTINEQNAHVSQWDCN